MSEQSTQQPERSSHQGFLSAYRVLDLTDEKGFFCGKMLAELGADVLMIEPPGGSPARNIGPFYQNVAHPEKSLLWLAYNIGKRGITLNIETHKGQELFRQLARSADVIIESFPPGHMERLGLDYPKLNKLNPRIILVSITPFGQTGPYSHYKASDIVTMAMGGLMSLCGDPDRAPLRFSAEQSYVLSGAQAAMGALVALHSREVTGEGQHVDVSMQESVLFGAQLPIMWWDIAKVIRRRQGQRSAYGAGMQLIWPCKNGYIMWQILTGIVGSGTQALVDWMDSNGMAGDMKETHWEEIDVYELYRFQGEQLERWERLFSQFFLLHTKEELYEEAQKRGFMLYPVNTVENLLVNPQLQARDFWIQVEHTDFGTTVPNPGAPFRSSHTPWGIRCCAPRIGEHNKEIYLKELGLSKKEFSILQEANVI
jgi:crotonobetainyl-CoA:carnitine CoA-transferase CaiB-like acyl-CoA transferase